MTNVTSQNRTHTKQGGAVMKKAEKAIGQPDRNSDLKSHINAEKANSAFTLKEKIMIIMFFSMNKILTSGFLP